MKAKTISATMLLFGVALAAAEPRMEEAAEPRMEEAAEPRTEEAAESRLGGVIFEGVSNYSPEALLPLYRADLGAPLDDSLSARIAAGLVARYDADGSLPPVIELVPLDTSAGVLVFNVKEPAIRRITVSGKELVTDARFWQQLADLKAEQPLGKRTFRDWLARVNRLDGMLVTGTVTPSGGSGADYSAQLRITTNPLNGMLHVDNRAPEALGNEVVQGQVAYRFSDARAGQLRAGAAIAVDVDRLQYASIAGTHGFNDAGSAFEWSASRSESSLPSADPSETDDYERSRTTVGLRTPIHRGAAGRIDAWTTLQLYDVDKFDFAGTLVREDRIRSAEIGVATSAMGSRTRRHDLTFALNQGLDAFDANVSEPSVTQQPDVDFLRFELTYRFAQQLGERWNMSLAVQSQWSADHLPVSERFFIGGRQLGGAFDPASVAGDRGIGVRAEAARYVPAPFLAAPAQSYVYYDYGLARSNNPDFEADAASSVGAGVRLSIGKLAVYLEAATPVQEPDTNPLVENGARVFFALTQRF